MDEKEQNEFITENSDDLKAELEGIDTDGDTQGKEPATDGDAKGATEHDADEQNVQKAEAKPEESEQKPKKPSRAERRIRRQQEENKKLKEELERLKAERAKAYALKEPSVDDFDSYEEYQEALDRYEAKQDEPKEEPVDESAPSLDTELLHDVLEEGAEKYDDFNELTMAKDLPLTADILDDVIGSENAADIIYYLAKNKEETKDIAGMSDKERTKALLRIELGLEDVTINVGAKKKVSSKAPEPITPIEGGTERPVNLEEASFEEYEKLTQAKRRTDGW